LALGGDKQLAVALFAGSKGGFCTLAFGKLLLGGSVEMGIL
jgi:hypothetical protein